MAMSTSTKTGGDTPIAISMDPAITFITTVKVFTSIVEAETSSEVMTHSPEVVETMIESAALILFNAPSPTSTVVEPTALSTPTEDEGKSSVLSRAFIPSTTSTLRTTIASSVSDSASPVSTVVTSSTLQSKPSLSVTASIGIGVSMGIVAFLIIVGVGYAVFGRYLRNTKRGSDCGMGVTKGNR